MLLMFLIESGAYAADWHIIQIDRENIIIHFRGGKSRGETVFFSWPPYCYIRGEWDGHSHTSSVVYVSLGGFPTTVARTTLPSTLFVGGVRTS